MLDVLVDMTALNTGSRYRGIGSYVRSLCLALAARSSWLDQYPDLREAPLEVAGLTRLRGTKPPDLDPSLLFAGDPEARTSAQDYRRHKLERRLFLGGAARRTGARLLHLPDPPGTPWDRRLPRIVTCHDLVPLVLAHDYLAPVPGARALQRAYNLARYKTATRVIAISQATRRDLIEHVGVPAERIDVVHHGVDHRRFSPLAAPHEAELLQRQLGLAEPYLLYIGGGDPRKNLPLLVRAFARSGVSRDAMLVLAGPLGDGLPAVQAAIEGAGLAERVRVLGFVEDELVAALYRQCLAHVFPSSYEGFGLPVLEAMACGAPTLTTSLSSLAEVAGDAALTIDRLDEETLVEALLRLATDAALRAELRERGLQRAATFTWERCAAETLRCYQRALAAG